MGAEKTQHLTDSTSQGARGSLLWVWFLFIHEDWYMCVLLINVITNPFTLIPPNSRQRERCHHAQCWTKQRDGFSSRRTYCRSIKQGTKGHNNIRENNEITQTAEKVEVSAKQQLNHYQAEPAIFKFFFFTFHLAATLRIGLIFCIIMLFSSASQVFR